MIGQFSTSDTTRCLHTTISKFDHALRCLLIIDNLCNCTSRKLVLDYWYICWYHQQCRWTDADTSCLYIRVNHSLACQYCGL